MDGLPATPVVRCPGDRRRPCAGLLTLLFLLLPAPAHADSFRLVGVGDFAFPQGKYDEELDRTGADFLDGFASVLKGADLKFVNLEAPVTDRPFKVKKEYQYRIPARRLGWLVERGFNLVSLANNHMGDAGPEGVADTEAELERLARGRKLAWAGAGRRHFEGVDVSGDYGKARFLAVSCTRYGLVAKPGPWLDKAIRDARRRHMTVIVSAHCGTEYAHRPDASVIDLYRGWIDAGADVVLGHHPHVVQGVEARGQGVIFYSLGNFALASRTRRHHATGAKLYGLAARVDFVKGRPRRAALVPLWVDNSDALTVDGKRLEPTPFRPQVARGVFAAAILDAIRGFSRDVEGNRTRFEREGDVDVVEIGGGK